MPFPVPDEEAAFAPRSIDTTLERAFSKSSLDIPAASAFSSADCCADVRFEAEVGLSKPDSAELIAACLAFDEDDDEGVEVEVDAFAFALAFAAEVLIALGVADFLPLRLALLLDDDPPSSNELSPAVVDVLPLLALRV